MRRPGRGVAATLALALWCASGAATASADTASFTGPGCSTWTVPAGVTSVALDAVGSAGGQGAGSGGAGGKGDGVSETVAVTHGQVLDVCVGVGGAGGGTGTNAGGAGGGASGVSLGTNFSAPVIVAGGGGGGGGTANGFKGSAGVSADGGGGATTANGPGAGTAGANGTGGGGGGGGGYKGGSGGHASGTLSGGGGGAAGTDLCPTGCVTSTGAGTTTSSAQVTVAYTVAGVPTASISAPAAGAVYGLNAVAGSSFKCTEGASGPGIASCTDQNGQASGARVDTATAGAHRFTVTATSQDGLRSTVSAVYQVVQGPTVSSVQALRGGVITLRVTVYGAGAVDAISSAGFRSFALGARAADAIPPPLGTFVFGRAHAAANGAQTLSVRVPLSQAGKLLMRDHRRTAIQLLVYYTTPGGTAQLVKSQAVAVSR